MTAVPLTDSVSPSDQHDLDAAWRAATARARRLAQPLALALLGVQGAPGGADLGDGARRHLGRLLQARLRPGDQVVRFGDEAFVLLLAGTDARGALPIVRRLQRELASELDLCEQGPAPLAFWAGVTGSAGGDGLAGALARADAAMRQAMRAGTGRVAAG